MRDCHGNLPVLDCAVTIGYVCSVGGVVSVLRERGRCFPRAAGSHQRHLQVIFYASTRPLYTLNQCGWPAILRTRKIFIRFRLVHYEHASAWCIPSAEGMAHGWAVTGGSGKGWTRLAWERTNGPAGPGTRGSGLRTPRTAMVSTSIPRVASTRRGILTVDLA